MINKNTKKTASTKDMDHAIKLVASQFNLGGDYTLVSFKDGANKCQISLANKDFKVTVDINDKVSYMFPSIVGEEVAESQFEEDEELEDDEEEEEE